MRRIEYNIAAGRKPDYTRLIIASIFMLSLTAGFLSLGLRNLSNNEREIRIEMDKLDRYRSTVEKISRKSKEYHDFCATSVTEENKNSPADNQLSKNT